MIKKPIKLYGIQHDFATCPDRFSAFIGGIGSGKTTAGAAKAYEQTTRPGTLGMIVAPTYTMLRDATLRVFREIAGDTIVAFNKTEMRAILHLGAEVLFRSADDPDKLRGPSLSWAYIDEAALCPAQTWEIVIGRLRQKGKAGPCWITTTPKGRNWVYERSNLMTVFRARTQDNPYLDPEYVRSLEQAYSGKFALQELAGEFVTFEGLVYDEFDRSIHVAERKGPWKQVIAGVDEGYTNPAVILVIGLDNDDRAHLIDEFYCRRVLQGDVVAKAKHLRNKYDVSVFYIDPSAAGLIAEMRSEGLPVQPADHSVIPGIQAIKARLAIAGDGQPRLTVSPSCPNTIAEFESYSWKEGRQGLKDEPEKVNDHAMDALRYALLTNSQSRSGIMVEFVQHRQQKRPRFRLPWE